MKKLRVLLVDDEIMIREGFKRLFDWEGHDCQVVGEAANGREALSQIDTLTPDIVIMDINIPIMNGLKVIQLARMKHPETAFVIVSGYDDFASCREALRLQITDYILKPVNYDEFGACIDNLKIALFRSHTPPARPAPGGAAHPGHHPVSAGAPGPGHQPVPAGGGVPPEPPVYQPAVQRRDRREFPGLSHQYPHGAGQKAAVHGPVHCGGVGAVGLWRLSGVHQGVQEIRGGDPPSTGGISWK